MPNFKTCPLNRKVNNYLIIARHNVEKLDLFLAFMQIFSSKGEMGVYRNSKQETTIPMVNPFFLSVFP